MKRKKHTPRLPDYLREERETERDTVSEKEKLDEIHDGEIDSDEEEFFEKI